MIFNQFIKDISCLEKLGIIDLMSQEVFTITRRHYDIVLKQAQTNYPEECGGFLGGTGLNITAVFPVFNQHLFNKTDTFGVTSEDITRAHEFFKKHNLDYLGIYHTHPKAPATPSEQDLSHIQRYMFIISLEQFHAPDFACYKVNCKAYTRLPLHINEKDVTVKDIHAPAESQKPEQSSTVQSLNNTQNSMPSLPKKRDYLDEANDLESRLNRIASSQNQYIKEDSIDPNTDFSTLA